MTATQWRARGVAAVVWAAAATAGAAPPAGGRPLRAPWLHRAAAAPEASALPATLLRLSPEREAGYREQGLGTVELWHRDELEWKDPRTLHKRSVRVRQHLTAEGVRQSGEMDVRVRTQLEDLWIEEAFALLPDGSRRAVDLDAIQLVTRGSDVFSDVVTLVIPFDGLVPGATAVLVTRLVERVGGWPLPWSEIYFPQQWVPLELYEFEARWTDSMPPRALQTDAAFLECTSGPGRAGCRAERVPAVPALDDAPIWLDVLPQLVVAEPQGWDDLVRAERKLVEAAIASDRGVEAALRRVLDAASGDEERLDRIHRFVADRIRYLALEHGAAAVAPTPVARTLDVRYGDCKAKVALLVALARRAGIPAYAVLVSTARNALDKLILPSWQYFDHMIVCVERGGTQGPLCLDPTTANAPTGVLPQALYGSVALDLRDGAALPRQIQLPQTVVEIEARADTHLACSGELTQELVRTHFGVSAVSERSALRGATVEQRTRWAREEFRLLLGDKTAPSFSWSGLDDVTQPVAVTSRTSLAGAFARDQTEYFEFDTWLSHYARRFATTNNRYPWFVPGVSIRSAMKYTLCRDDKVRFVGADLDLRSEFGSLTRSFKRTGATVLVVTSLQLPPQTIPAHKLERYRSFLDRALGQTVVWLKVERNGRREPAP